MRGEVNSDSSVAAQVSGPGSQTHLFEPWTRLVRTLAARPAIAAEIAGICAAFAIIAIAGGRLAGPDHVHEAFRDFGPASFLTATLTAGCATLGFLIAKGERGQDSRDVGNFWFLSGVGFLFLSIDAPLDIHGYIGSLIHFATGVDGPPGMHRWSDSVLFGYMIAGGVLIALHRRHLQASPPAAAYFGLATVLTLTMLAVDATVEPSPRSTVLEEVIELFAASCFVGAYAAWFRRTDAQVRGFGQAD